jgi:VWFA-related protein
MVSESHSDPETAAVVRTRRRGVLLLVLLLTFVSAPAAPAFQQTDDGTLRVNTRLVLLDVVVRDDDDLVEDLTLDDFSLIDDGVRRPVSVFTITRSDVEADLRPLPEGVVSNRRDANGRTPSSATAILIDRLNTSPAMQLWADHQVKEFLASVGGGDRVAVYELTDVLRILHDYTMDPRDALGAVEDIRPIQTVGLDGSIDSLNATIGDRELEEFLAGAGDEELVPVAAFTELVERSYLEIRADTTAAALEAIVLHLTSLPGRKNLVWLSGSFPYSFEPYRHPAFNFEVRNSTLDRLEATGRILTDSNVAVYPIFVGGAVDGLVQSGLELMMDLADRTGGEASFNTNGLATRMHEAVDDARLSYTLGFYVNDDELDVGFHELDVRVDRPDVDVRHREGYWGFGAERPTEVTPGLEDLLLSPTNASGVGLTGSVTAVDGRPDDYDLLLIADTRDLGLTYDGTHWNGVLEMAMYFAAVAEDPRVFPLRQIEVRMTDAEFETAQQVGFLILTRVETAGYTGWMRIVVRDQSSGEAGSLRVPIGMR